MPEEKKLRFLMRGVKQDLFVVLVRKPPNTVSEFVAEAAGTEKPLDMRVSQYDRPMNALGTENIANTTISYDMVRETIRAVVMEEVKKRLPTTAQPQVTSLTDVIRE